jgi:hypothetical protein
VHWPCMSPKPVSADQFSVDCDLITHKPTGAQFLVVPNGLVSTCWGLAGIAPGAEYDLLNSNAWRRR